MRQKPTAALIVNTRAAWEAAALIGRAAQKKVIDDAAASIGLSYSAFTRHLALNARRRSYGEAEEVRIEEVNGYARKVYDFVAQCEHDGHQMTTITAYSALVSSGQIPTEISKKQVYAAIERLKLKNESLSVAAKFRGQKKGLGMIQVDYSKSRNFMFNVHGRISYHPGISKNEKRLWIGAAIDDYSRAVFFKYYIADGENTAFVRDVLIDVFEQKDIVDINTGECRRAKVLCGIPSNAYMDRGPGNASAEIKNGLAALGVNLILGANEKDSLGRETNRSNKKARGKIERAIQTFKVGFENEMVALEQLGKLPPSLTLDWLNEQVRDFCERYNSEKHPVLDATRWQLFEASLDGVIYPPEDARMFFGKTFVVTVYQRLIHVSKEYAFKAPAFVSDGEEVHVIKSGFDYYLWHNGKRVKLIAQGATEEPKEKPASEYVEGLYLREAMRDEIDRMSGGECALKSLPESLDDDIKEFFEKPRSREDIRMKAQYFVDEVMRKKGKNNIIQFEEIQ